MVDREGNVTDIKIVRSAPMPDQAAVDAVRQWKFTPTTINGVPVSVMITVTVSLLWDLSAMSSTLKSLCSGSW